MQPHFFREVWQDKRTKLCRETAPITEKKQTGEKTVQISGSKLKGLSGNDTDNNLQNLNSDIDEDTFELVLFKVGDDVVKRLKLIDKNPADKSRYKQEQR